MQITNLVVYYTSKSSIYRRIKPPLVDEHAFPMKGFFARRIHVTFGGSGGIMSTARPELPYPCNSKAKPRDETSRRGSDVTGAVTDINRYANYSLGGFDTSQNKGSLYKQIKSSLVGEHAFLRTGLFARRFTLQQ